MSSKLSPLSDKECYMCKSSSNDPQLGEKGALGALVAHHFCLLLSASMTQSGRDNEGFQGFVESDLKKEHRRAASLRCAYCKGKHANVGCSNTKCKRSFHLPCALANGCRSEFSGVYPTFCHEHLGIERPAIVHAPTDTCNICYDDLGEYNPVQSVQSPCCNPQTWYHKACLMAYAQNSGYFMKCPLCNDNEAFRSGILKMGVFIPNRDAQWEEMRGFYNFDQQDERSKKCAAIACYCAQGRYHFDVRGPNSAKSVCCIYCGSKSAHKLCSAGEEFVCHECTITFSVANDGAALWSDESSDSSSSEPSEEAQEPPKQCDAGLCKSTKGRDQFAEDGDGADSPVHCIYCGASWIHRCCMFAAEFSCKQCTREILTSELLPEKSQLMRALRLHVPTPSASQIFQTSISNNSSNPDFSLPSTSDLTDISFESNRVLMADGNNNYADADAEKSSPPVRKNPLFRIVDYSPEWDMAEVVVPIERLQWP